MADLPTNNTLTRNRNGKKVLTNSTSITIRIHHRRYSISPGQSCVRKSGRTSRYLTMTMAFIATAWFDPKVAAGNHGVEVPTRINYEAIDTRRSIFTTSNQPTPSTEPSTEPSTSLTPTTTSSNSPTRSIEASVSMLGSFDNLDILSENATAIFEMVTDETITAFLSKWHKTSTFDIRTTVVNTQRHSFGDFSSYGIWSAQPIDGQSALTVAFNVEAIVRTAISFSQKKLENNLLKIFTRDSRRKKYINQLQIYDGREVAFDAIQNVTIVDWGKADSLYPSASPASPSDSPSRSLQTLTVYMFGSFKNLNVLSDNATVIFERVTDETITASLNGNSFDFLEIQTTVVDMQRHWFRDFRSYISGSWNGGSTNVGVPPSQSPVGDSLLISFNVVAIIRSDTLLTQNMLDNKVLNAFNTLKKWKTYARRLKNYDQREVAFDAIDNIAIIEREQVSTPPSASPYPSTLPSNSFAPSTTPSDSPSRNLPSTYPSVVPSNSFAPSTTPSGSPSRSLQTFLYDAMLSFDNIANLSNDSRLVFQRVFENTVKAELRDVWNANLEFLDVETRYTSMRAHVFGNFSASGTAQDMPTLPPVVRKLEYSRRVDSSPLGQLLDSEHPHRQLQGETKGLLIIFGLEVYVRTPIAFNLNTMQEAVLNTFNSTDKTSAFILALTDMASNNEFNAINQLEIEIDLPQIVAEQINTPPTETTGLKFNSLIVGAGGVLGFILLYVAIHCWCCRRKLAVRKAGKATEPLSTYDSKESSHPVRIIEVSKEDQDMSTLGDLQPIHYQISGPSDAIEIHNIQRVPSTGGFRPGTPMEES